jgi:hypothetical protein
MTPAPADRDAGFKNCCMNTGRSTVPSGTSTAVEKIVGMRLPRRAPPSSLPQVTLWRNVTDRRPAGTSSRANDADVAIGDLRGKSPILTAARAPVDIAEGCQARRKASCAASTVRFELGSEDDCAPSGDGKSEDDPGVPTGTGTDKPGRKWRHEVRCATASVSRRRKVAPPTHPDDKGQWRSAPISYGPGDHDEFTTRIQLGFSANHATDCSAIAPRFVSCYRLRDEELRLDGSN